MSVISDYLMLCIIFVNSMFFILLMSALLFNVYYFLYRHNVFARLIQLTVGWLQLITECRCTMLFAILLAVKINCIVILSCNTLYNITLLCNGAA